MQGHTKKPLTDAISVTFTGPVSMRQQALEIMRCLGFQPTDEEPYSLENEDSIPWRESAQYRELLQNPPAVFLSGARYREGLTQAELAARADIPRRHISEMENGKRPIGKQNARKLAEVLNVDPRRFFTI